MSGQLSLLLTRQLMSNIAALCAMLLQLCVCASGHAWHALMMQCGRSWWLGTPRSAFCNLLQR